MKIICSYHCSSGEKTGNVDINMELTWWKINAYYICKVLVKGSEECGTNYDIQEKDKEIVIIALV